MSNAAFIKYIKKGKSADIADLYRRCTKNVTHEEASKKSLYQLAVDQHSVQQLEAIRQGTGLDWDVFDRDNLINPISYSALLGFGEGIEYLVKNKADINCRNINNETPLMIAAAKADLSMVKLLVKLGADVNARNQNGNALTYAALNGNQNNFKFLYSISPNMWKVKDCNGINALQHSVSNELYQAVKLILSDNKNDVNIDDIRIHAKSKEMKNFIGDPSKLPSRVPKPQSSLFMTTINKSPPRNQSKSPRKNARKESQEYVYRSPSRRSLKVVEKEQQLEEPAPSKNTQLYWGVCIILLLILSYLGYNYVSLFPDFNELL